MIEKLKSRKFILAVVTMLLGVVTALTELGGTFGTACGIIAAVLSPLVYIIVEGNIDAKAVNLITEATENIVDIIKNDDKGVGDNGKN